MARVVLAMSGGVDSSVAAHLLSAAGHEVLGVFIHHGNKSPVAQNSENGLPVIERPDFEQGCCTMADAEDAGRVAELLGIDFRVLDLDEEFGEVIDYFVGEYSAGRTPNPCVQCNNRIKFGKLFHFADEVGAEFLATGHYARIVPDAPQGPALLRGRDGRKDQSYVLAGVRRECHSRMLLPVGEHEKPAIRRMAAELGFEVADKPDSQEICFIRNGRYDEFVRARRDPGLETAGELVTTDGTVVGTHSGIEGFTVGQRKGLGVALGEPKFVVRIERDSRRVVLGDRQDLSRSELTADGANWLVDPEGLPGRCLAQIRYNAPAVPARLGLLEGGRFRVEFDDPQQGVAPGQAVVCYEGDRALGCGWIE